MSFRLRNISLALVGASALVLASALPAPFGAFDNAASAKSDNAGGNGGGGGGGSGGNGGGGSSATASSNGNGHSNASGTPPGQSKIQTNFASNGNASAGGTSKSVIRQYVLQTGLKQGTVASTLKSWNSLNRNPRAFAAAVKNASSLPALQIAYIKGNMLAQDTLATFIALGGDPDNPPTEQQFQDAQALLSAEQQLTDAGVDAATVLADPATYPDLVDAANTVTNYTGADAQTVVEQFNAWTEVQTAEAAAADAFKAASVSYRNADQATLDALRALVDDIVKVQGLDTMASSL